MSTHTKNKGGKIAQSGETTPEKLFDMLMEQIEPDLTSVRVEALDFVYAGESEEQHAARMARYEKAFALLDERVKTLFGAWQKEIQDYKRAFIQKKIAPSQAEDAKVMSDISTSIDSI